MLIDANVSLGHWPFNLVPPLGAAELAAELRRQGIGRAFVSPVAAILAPDPMPANRELFAALRRAPALRPVPVANPALAHWREQIAFAAAGPERALKLFPNYHNYRIDSRRHDAFFAEVRTRRLRLLIGARVEDDRHRYHALAIKDVPVKELAPFLRRHPEMHPLILGLGLPQLRELAKQCDNFSTDTSFAEWLDGLAGLAREFPVRRIFFGSHAPFFVAAASVAKLAASGLPARTRAVIGGANAARFFSR